MGAAEQLAEFHKLIFENISALDALNTTVSTSVGIDKELILQVHQAVRSTNQQLNAFRALVISLGSIESNLPDRLSELATMAILSGDEEEGRRYNWLKTLMEQKG